MYWGNEEDESPKEAQKSQKESDMKPGPLGFHHHPFLCLLYLFAAPILLVIVRHPRSSCGFFCTINTAAPTTALSAEPIRMPIFAADRCPSLPANASSATKSDMVN